MKFCVFCFDSVFLKVKLHLAYTNNIKEKKNMFINCVNIEGKSCE